MRGAFGPLRGSLLAGLLVGSVGCGGGGGGSATVAAPSGVAYAVSPAAYRMGDPATPDVPSVTGSVSAWSIAPALPAGLTFDPASGTIAGTPTVTAVGADYTVTATNAGGQTTTTLHLLVGPPLPPEVLSLPLGFAIDTIASGLTKSVKFALAPDGRIFFNEHKTGKVRVIDAAGNLLATPFATLTIQGAGSHQGLVGLALSPTFAADGYVYVLFSAPPDGTHATDHMRLERFTDVASVGTNETVILDNLTTASSNDGCDLVFDAAGNLFVSLGDATVPANAQDPTVLPGKVLRITPLGGIPADNPDPTSRVYSLGIRNTYGLAVHPVTGGLFGVDNGSAADDELNLIQPGKNYEWGAQNPVPGALTGLRLRVWHTEIVPTALAWHFGGPWGTDFQDNLFVSSYADEEVLRYQMSGPAKTDIDNDLDHPIFLKLVANQTNNKPLDLVVAPDGSLYVCTFTTLYRIRKLT